MVHSPVLWCNLHKKISHCHLAPNIQQKLYQHHDDKFRFGVRFWIAIPFEYADDNNNDEYLTDQDSDLYIPDISEQMVFNDEHYESQLCALSARYIFSDCFVGSFIQNVVVNGKSIPQTKSDYVNIWVCNIKYICLKIYIFSNFIICLFTNLCAV